MREEVLRPRKRARVRRIEVNVDKIARTSEVNADVFAGLELVRFRFAVLPTFAARRHFLVRLHSDGPQPKVEIALDGFSQGVSVHSAHPVPSTCARLRRDSEQSCRP